MKHDRQDNPVQFFLTWTILKSRISCTCSDESILVFSWKKHVRKNCKCFPACQPCYPQDQASSQCVGPAACGLVLLGVQQVAGETLKKHTICMMLRTCFGIWGGCHRSLLGVKWLLIVLAHWYCYHLPLLSLFTFTYFYCTFQAFKCWIVELKIQQWQWSWDVDILISHCKKCRFSKMIL